jgi:hypothetical protein
LKDRLKALLVEYGTLALWVYFAIFGIVWVGFAIAIMTGAKINGTIGTAGVWGAAYLATKLTQPLRILATLAITPAVGALLHRKNAKSNETPSTRSLP